MPSAWRPTGGLRMGLLRTAATTGSTAAVAILTACTGAIGDKSGDVSPGAACVAGPGRVGLQRLTRAEYNRTVRDLFGITRAHGDAFPLDSATDGSDNNAKRLTTRPQLAALLLDAAEAVATEAMQTRKSEILVCDPAAIGEQKCARSVLSALALRVYRRPPSEAEIDSLMTMVAFAEKEG